MGKTIGKLSVQSSVRRLDVDEITLTYIVDGAMGMVPETFFRSFPSTYWRDHQRDLNDGLVPMSAGGLLVERDGHRLLIDTGLGPVVSDDRTMRCNGGDLLKTMASVDIDPQDIELVAFTHLHLDHTGWAFIKSSTTRADSGPVFDEATYVVAEAEMALLGKSSTHTYTRNTTSLRESLRNRCDLKLISDGDEIAPGITAIVTPGHTPGHTSYLMTTRRGRRVLAVGDAFHTPAQIANTAWRSDPDSDPTAVPGARARVLAELLFPNTIGFAFHFGDQPFGRVTASPRGELIWQAVPTTALLPPPRQL